MLTIRKAVATRIPPDQFRAGIEALTSRSGTSGPGPGDAEVEARLRELALHLASYPDLRVSVIIYEDGSAELEVLHAGPPHHTEATIDRREVRRAARGRIGLGRGPDRRLGARARHRADPRHAADGQHLLTGGTYGSWAFSFWSTSARSRARGI